MPNPPFHPSRAGRSGFTLIELMVAISITMIILAVIQILFSSVSQAVSLGGATSAMMGDTRGVSDQIDRDGASMVGPSAGGYLVIRTGSVTAQVITPKRMLTASRSVQTDQFAFIAVRGTMEPLCPGNNSYSNSSTAPYVLIDYGHGRKTNPDGSDGGDLGSAPNDVASTWVLCRPALFLQGNIGLNVYADGVAPGAAVGGSDLAHGQADISSWTLENLTANVASGAFNLTDLTFANNRIRVNPLPNDPTFSPSTIAQGHAAFIANVSDFFVEFAADKNGNGRVDTVNGGADTTGGVTWYHEDLTCTPTSNNWPYMIRLRWRMHDKRGKIATNGQSGKWFEQVIKVNRD